MLLKIKSLSRKCQVVALLKDYKIAFPCTPILLAAILHFQALSLLGTAQNNPTKECFEIQSE